MSLASGFYLNDDPGDWRVLVRDSWESAGFGVVVLRLRGKGAEIVRFTEDGMALEFVEEGAVYGEPTMHVPSGMLKALVDAAAEVGMRPDAHVKREAGAEGRLDATERHLRDMRRLVFRAIPPDSEQES